MSENYVLTLSCPDQVGIVAKVTQCIAQHHANIICADQHGESSNKTFFMRVEIERHPLHDQLLSFKRDIHDIANAFNMDWQLHDHQQKKTCGDISQ